jgi:hypothetical protein
MSRDPGRETTHTSVTLVIWLAVGALGTALVCLAGCLFLGALGSVLP